MISLYTVNASAVFKVRNFSRYKFAWWTAIAEAVPGASGTVTGQRTMEGCWRKAVKTSSSSTVFLHCDTKVSRSCCTLLDFVEGGKGLPEVGRDARSSRLAAIGDISVILSTGFT